MDPAQTMIEMRKITKRFGDFTANHNIDLELHKGEVQAILGENGAGKSTLMNILYGLLRPSEGEICIKGQKVEIDNPKKAIQLGIGMVHQHFMLVAPFTITENIVLGDEPLKKGCLDMRSAREKVVELSERYGLRVDPDAKIEDISVGMQQRVEILKVLFRGADILIFDEPTASLTPQEIDELAEIIDNLAREGKSILIITHKLKEIKAMADTCMIIRSGEWIGKVDVSETSENDLAAMMVGRNVSFQVEKKDCVPGEVVLDVHDLVVKDYRNVNVVNGLDIQVRRGEIVGIAGVDGNGQIELIEALTGLRKAESGHMTVLGKNVLNAAARETFKAGISSIPEDRHKFGLVLDFDVADNLILQNHAEKEFASHGWMLRKNILEHGQKLIETFDIRPRDSAEKAARTLSGGNQQKVIIAREITNDKDLLICVNPTRGLDVGAIEYVHQYIVEARNQNKAVLLVSFEIDEIMNVSDRIEVIFEGKIVASKDPKQVTEAELGLEMAGGGKQHAAR